MNELRARLEKELGDRVRTDPETLADHRHDQWVLSDLLDIEKHPGPSPLAVVEARSTEDVQRTLRLCRELRLPVVPFGGGSGVCGAIRVSERSVVLATRGLDGLVELDDESLTATFRAGTLGLDAEQRVQQAGLTIGHWPQSIDVSCVGGWVATRAAGQYSTGYGNIEDVVLALEVVLPDGSLLKTRATPRAAAGPDLRQLFLGSEGSLGVVTEVTFSLRPLPEASRGQAFHFPGFNDGLQSIRKLMRVGWRPPVVRLYDAPDSQRHFSDFCPEGRHILILLHEGPAGAVAAELVGVAAICRDNGGVESDPASVDHWLEQRNEVPSLRELLEKGIVADTIEVAATWDRVGRLHEEAIRSLSQVPDLLLATAHSSHSYRSGTNLYITFAVRPRDPARMAQSYRECWKRTMDVTLEVGGGISHHHGIGRMRRDLLPEEIGTTGVRILRAVKRALDPDQLLNPGALLPESSSEDG
jgi:alkyldihydroxyacetonephosphate synthase